MSNYIKATNFTAKDSLLSGNPSKIIKGAEIDAEFNAISTAINTKPDANSPTLTGVPLAPTAIAGTNTTQIATTAFATTAIQTALQVAYPVGSIYISTVSTNPSSLFGFGTWVVFGAGRVLIGVSGTAPYTAGNTGGSADAVVVAHTHTGTTDSTSLTGTVANIAESFAISGTASGVFTKGSGTSAGTPQSTDTSASGSFSMNASHTHPFTTASTGVSATNANLQPYVVVYMWNRTA